ncbi:MAG: HAD-IIA family hydrolase [Candidatus Methanomethylophilaceae archaeon]|nr:HAD-IIA family hydrolase [Candidatus Methanomethylophilaceae archaeon]
MEYYGFMIDMDGTVYKGGNLINGAVEFIDYLKEVGIPFVFLTNNSSRNRSFYYSKLKKMGFDVLEKNVLTSNIATIRYVKDNYSGKKVFPIASEDVAEEISDSGITLSEKDPDIVYLTFDKTITYDKLNDAYHHILAGAKLVATHPDDVCPTENSYDVDIGPFIRLFESLGGVKAEVVGKPNLLMLEMAAKEMNVSKDHVVMVGDRLYTDIKMAFDAGTPSILVLSGETSKNDLENSDIKPTYVVDSVKDIPKLLESMK